MRKAASTYSAKVTTTLPMAPLSASTLRKLEQLKSLSDAIGALPSLYPCEQVNGLFEALVSACIDAEAEEEEVAQQLDALVRYFSRREDSTGHRPGGALSQYLQDRQSLIVRCAEA
jgi:hypothetical protein